MYDGSGHSTWLFPSSSHVGHGSNERLGTYMYESKTGLVILQKAFDHPCPTRKRDHVVVVE